MEHFIENYLILPISEPVLVFTFILVIALVIPILLHNTKTPAIIGLIITGIIIGPNAINIIDNNDIIELFSKVGLLYIMFLAALDIEFTEFRKNRTKSIFFGLLSFILPFAMGYYASLYLLSLPEVVSVLIGILLASNTLIAYPIVKKLNISRNSAVNIAISGTVIADTIVLAVLAFTSAVLLDDGELMRGLGVFFISFIIFSFLIFWGVPRISRWFFHNIPGDSHTQFLFVLAILFMSSFAAEIAGAEPIIGAFFAGLALNRLIPRTSTLMSHIELVGNTLFIPVFLISVGMLVNLGSIVESYKTSLFAALLIVLAISSKWIAAFMTKITFRQSFNEMNTIFGLTSARAAATLAIALVGYNYGIMSKDIFNAIILLILASSLISSFLTEKYGKKLALEESEQTFEDVEIETERIMVPVSNPETMAKLTEVAIYIRSLNSAEPLYTLFVVSNPQKNGPNKLSVKASLEKIVAHANTMEVRVQNIVRNDISVSQAIVKSSKELLISKIILGWSGRSPEMNKIFGNILESTLKGTNKEVIVCNLPVPINTMEHIKVYVPENAENEIGFSQWIITLINLNRQLSAKFSFYSPVETNKAIKEVMGIQKYKQAIEYKESIDLEAFLNQSKNAAQTFFVIVSSRPQYISFKLQLWKFTYFVPETIGNKNFLIIYPRQV